MRWDNRSVVSRENVEIVRFAYEQYQSNGEFLDEFMAPDMVWDMSHYPGWVERTTYEGVEGGKELVADWTEMWDLWQYELDGFVDAGEKVVVMLVQRSQSTITKVPVTLCIAQVYTMRDGKAVRMDAYATPGDALRACGLAE